MAVSNHPESMCRFVQKNKSFLPLVVEVADGIYGSRETDSEVRDFSNGDILRLLSVKEEVNITFDAVYSQASKKGLITVDKNFSGAQFEVESPFQDGHIYETLNQMMTDCPVFVHAVRKVKVGEDIINKGDRLKFIAKSGITEMPWLQYKNIRTSQTVKLTGDMGQCFAKKKDKSESMVNIVDIYDRLPQRVRMVHDVGQAIRSKYHDIPGLDPDFDGEMNLSKIEIVEACPWENPEITIHIPMTTDMCVYPRKDWGDKIGPVVDIHDLAKDASPLSKKAAVVVDYESKVPGCPKDTIIVVHGSQTQDFAVAKGRDNASVLIPRNYPSLFKVSVEIWCTVEDLLQARMCQDVHVGTTFKAKEDTMDSLYEHDIVKLTCLETELFYATRDEYEVVKMYRSRSLSGKVGIVTVPTYARAKFYENAMLMGDNLLSKILAQDLPLRVTLSRPNLSSNPRELDADDDSLLRLSPLDITGQCKLSVVIGKPLSPSQQTDVNDVIAIPEVRKLAVRSITQPLRLHGDDNLLHPTTKIIRISNKEVQQINNLNEQTYAEADSRPLIPSRGVHKVETIHGKPPGRPPKPLDLVRRPSHTEKHQDKPPLLPPMRQPTSPTPSPSPRRPSFPKLLERMKSFPHREHNRHVDARDSDLNTKPPIQTENPYNSIGEGGSLGIGNDNKVTPRTHEENDADTDDDDYEKPDVVVGSRAPLQQSIAIPPTDGNISGFGLTDMIRFLKYLKVGRRMVDTFESKGIDGKKLCNLRKQCTDESLQRELGVDELKDRLALMYFVDKSM